jgi:hypothetical protein
MCQGLERVPFFLNRHSRESGNPEQATKRLPLDPRLRGGDEVVVQLRRNRV